MKANTAEEDDNVGEREGEILRVREREEDRERERS